MTIETIVLYSVAGLGIGAISGLLGIGGGVLLVPVLVWFFDFSHTKAVGTTLAVLVPPIGLMAALEYYWRGDVDVQAAAIIAAAFVLGSYAGALAVPWIHPQILRLLFGLMLLYIAVRFMLAADADVAGAYIGMVAVALAWLAFIWLRILGRRHLPRPSLGDSIRAVQQPDSGGTDYYI